MPEKTEADKAVEAAEKAIKETEKLMSGKETKPKPRHVKPVIKKPKKAAVRKKPTGGKKEKQPAETGIIISFRRGRHTQRTNQFLVEVEGVDSRAKAARFVGRKVVWTSPGRKRITGKVSSPHGNSGILRIRFEKGLPGTALTTRVTIR